MDLKNASTHIRQRIGRRKIDVCHRKLWIDFLRTCPTRIQRQKRIGEYIADFYCPSAELAILIQDSPTNPGLAHTRARYFTSKGLHVLRLSREDILNNFPSVCAQIDLRIRESGIIRN